jgi:arsenite-transporting ATPase
MASTAPGVDEIISLDLLLRLLERPEHDAVVLDTAPTGHTLRLLSLPDLMDKYFGRLMKWRTQFGRLGKHLRKLIKSDDAMDPEELGDQLAGARGRMQMLAELLRDPEQCSLILVTIPEAMSLLETARTLELLKTQKMPVAAVAVNMLQPEPGDCAFCRARHQAQLVHLERAREMADDIPLIIVESELAEPRGLEPLTELAYKVWAYNTVIG